MIISALNIIESKTISRSLCERFFRYFIDIRVEQWKFLFFLRQFSLFIIKSVQVPRNQRVKEIGVLISLMKTSKTIFPFFNFNSNLLQMRFFMCLKNKYSLYFTPLYIRRLKYVVLKGVKYFLLLIFPFLWSCFFYFSKVIEDFQQFLLLQPLFNLFSQTLFLPK